MAKVTGDEVTMVPDNHLCALREPHRSRIDRALAWAAKTQPEETDLETLLQRRPKDAVRSHVERA
jgi:hypothetical protein